MSREEEEGGRGFEVEVKVDSSSLLIPPDELRCEFDECKNWRLHEKEFCQLHYLEKLKKKKNHSKGVKRNRGEVEKMEKNDGKKKKGKKNDKGLKEKSELDDNGGVDKSGEKRNGKEIENREESEKTEVIVPIKKNGGNRNEVALIEKCDLDVNNGVSGDDLVMKEDLESKLVQKRTEIRCSTRSMTIARKNGDLITEKKSDEGGLDHGEDDKSGESNLEVSREEKKDATMEILVQNNEKKKQPSRNKGVEAKKDHHEVEELMHVEDDKKRAERNLQKREEDKQDEKMEILLMKEDGNITEKKIDEGELVEDDKGLKSNLQGNKEDEKMEVPMKKNDKRKKKKVKKDKVEEVQKNDLVEEQLLLVEDDKRGDEKILHEREEDKKDEEINNPVKKNEKKKVKKDKMEVEKRKEVDEGQLLQVDDKKGGEKNLHEQEDKKKEIDIPVKKNEKKNKSDKQGKGKKKDKGSERSLHEQEEDKKDKEIVIPVKKNVKKRKGEKNMGKEEKTNFDGRKGTKRNLQDLEDKNDKKIDIPVKKCKKNKGEDKQKIDLVGVHVLKASSELVECEPVEKCDDANMELSGEIQKLNDDVVEDKGTKESQQETEEGKIKIPAKRNAKKNKKNQVIAENRQDLETVNVPKDSSESMKVDGNSGRESDDKQKKESQQETLEGKIKNSVKRNAKKKNKGVTVNKQDSEIVNMPKNSSEPMKVEGKLGRESEDKNCDIAGSSHKLAGALKGHVLKSKGEPLVETKGELRHNTRSTVGGANVISEDGEQRIIVQALQAMPTGGAKDDKASKKTGSVKVAKQNPKESKKDKKLELPVKKKMNEVKGSLAKDLDDGATKVVKNSSNEKQGTVSNVEDEPLEDSEEAKVDFADNVGSKEKKIKGCVSKSKDETVVKDKQALEPKIERRSKRTTGS